jgi:broad specificity polyphosphatase/5'/3'-nucleotidase SurE
MLLRILFAAAVLSGCANLKPFPKVDFCSGVDDNGKQYAYCIPYYAGEKPEYELDSDVIFKKGYIMISPKHYGEVRKYIEYLKKQAEDRCQ